MDDPGTRHHAEPPRPERDASPALLADETIVSVRNQWSDIKADFVDDPDGALGRARELVDAAIESARDNLHDLCEHVQNYGPAETTTEDARIRMHQYRTILERLGTGSLA